jgi:hypothetical protein
MINSATHMTLLASLAGCLWSTSLRRWLPSPVSTVSLRSLHHPLGTIISIMPQLSTLEASTRLNRVGVSDRRPRVIVRTTQLRGRSSGCLRIEAMWLKRALHLHVLWVPPTRTIWSQALLRTVTRAGVAARLSMRLKLAFLFTHLLSLAFQPNSFVHQCLKVWEDVTLQLIV